jgi:SecD/SecF fusion protein
MTSFQAVALGLVILVVGLLWLGQQYLKPFFNRLAICLIVPAVAALFVIHAAMAYQKGEGGFKLGVDLVGGTILVYEVDPDKEMKAAYRDNPELLASSLKRRIDPADLYNVTIRPVGSNPPRVEIILPTGGKHQTEAEEQIWDNMVAEVKAKWPPPPGEELDVPRGNVPDLVATVYRQHPDVKISEIDQFIKDRYKSDRIHLTGEEIQRTKELIASVGSLEFRILANSRDDHEAIAAAEKFFEDAQKDPKIQADLQYLALKGKPPPPPPPPTPQGFPVKLRGHEGNFTYRWVELGRKPRHDFRLSNDFESQDSNSLWFRVAEKREKGLTYPLNDLLLWSRPVSNPSRLPLKDRDKKYEYFLLVRDPEKDQEVTGQFLTSATESPDRSGGLGVGFHFNVEGGNRFSHLTSTNAPEGRSDDNVPSFKRQLAILLDDQIASSASINAIISQDGIIEGNFTKTEVDRLVNILRSGALPATLKSQPVSESTMGATLGADTIVKGVWAVGVAFIAILGFMLIYYRFSGLVACIALLANLLLTVGFMVAVQATFTLPGLAGLVLMLGMAVDANVLIYERLREERDRGASLALAIRNGYDRAFPTIIDTHLSSIFTAIVLYTVGNDQLKGFGVSLTVGLFISLFTSLYMTRLMFDIWFAKNWLHKLSMFRLFSRPNIDFMRIRYYWFTATIFLTIIGFTVFVLRLPEGLNIDFRGGTAYGGELEEPMTITELRKMLDESSQKKRLQVVAVADAKVPGKEGFIFNITYKNEDGTEETRTIQFPNKPASLEEVKKDASVLPDLSVEQIFLDTDNYGDNRSRHFTVRTTEKAPELVQAIIIRLLEQRIGQDGKPLAQPVQLLKRIEMDDPKIAKDGKSVTLTFKNPRTKTPADSEQKEELVYASPGQVRMLLEREFEKTGITQQFEIVGEGKGKDGQFNKMQVRFREAIPEASLMTALKSLQNEFKQRPQPDRLETFDSQLALETQTRAMYAILASWGAILLYLWFRFGNWTFGLAAVFCLIHDLFFTLGIIAFCHYIHEIPWLSSFLLIQDFKIDLPAVAALLTLVGYSVNDTIVVFDRIREVRGKNPALTPQMINDSVNQTLSRTVLTSFATWLVVFVLYVIGGEGVHLFAFVMVVGVIVGTYSSIYIASPLLLIFGEGAKASQFREQRPSAFAAAQTTS